MWSGDPIRGLAVLVAVDAMPPDPGVRRSLSSPALPDAVAALLRGNHEVLRDFTDDEAGLLVALLTRLIANLDRVASVEASPGTPISEKGD